MQLAYDKALDVALGTSRKTKTWKNKPMQWSELLDRLATTTRTPETVAEYKAMSRSAQSERNTHVAINGRAVKEYTPAQMLKWYSGLHTDSAEYKMWGNGIALPCALYVMEGIAEELEKEESN